MPVRNRSMVRITIGDRRHRIPAMGLGKPDAKPCPVVISGCRCTDGVGRDFRESYSVYGETRPQRAQYVNFCPRPKSRCRIRDYDHGPLSDDTIKHGRIDELVVRRRACLVALTAEGNARDNAERERGARITHTTHESQAAA